ncbi:MAG: dihydroorotate dehydrogenase (quinone), partial [Pseudomonadota bacterium]
VLHTCGAHLDFATVNVSSPNTEALRDLQGKAALSALLGEAMKTRDALANRPVLFVKIAPDLTDADLADIAEVCATAGVDGIIATNTTVSRGGLTGPNRLQAGGLSGSPVFAPSTRVLARLFRLTEGRIPLIGVGGIASAEDAYAKIRAGATALQLYTALAYQGLSLVPEILRGLDKLAKADGLEDLSEARGVDADRWL